MWRRFYPKNLSPGLLIREQTQGHVGNRKKRKIPWREIHNEKRELMAVRSGDENPFRRYLTPGTEGLARIENSGDL